MSAGHSGKVRIMLLLNYYNNEAKILAPSMFLVLAKTMDNSPSCFNSKLLIVSTYFSQFEWLGRRKEENIKCQIILRRTIYFMFDLAKSEDEKIAQKRKARQSKTVLCLCVAAV